MSLLGLDAIHACGGGGGNLGCTGSMRAPSCELWPCLSSFDELWEIHDLVLAYASLTFTRVLGKVLHIPQSSDAGALCSVKNNQK